jgi:hypothetical protein
VDKLGKLVKLDLETKYEPVLVLHVANKVPEDGKKIGYLEIFSQEDRIEDRLILSALAMLERHIQYKK